MSVGAVMPYARAGSQREHLFNFTRAYLKGLGIKVTLGSASNVSGPASFNHPKAINEAVRYMDADTILIVDADTLPTGDVLEAINKVSSGEWPWAMPDTYLKLNQETTRAILIGARSPGDDFAAWDCDWIGERVSWAGVQIVRRESFLLVDGWDERFIGWGSDDACFGLAMDTLVGPHVRYPGFAAHLWHMQTPDDSYLHDNWGAQQALTQRYIDASGDPAEMRRVIGEAEN